MSEEQYVVPDGMLKAASNVIKTSHSWIPNPHGGIDRQCVKCGAIDFSSAGESLCSGIPPWRLEKLLEAAICWLVENVPVLTDKQWSEISEGAPLISKRMPYNYAVRKAIRRMFLAPDSEVDRIDFYVKTPEGNYVKWVPTEPPRSILVQFGLEEWELPEEIKGMRGILLSAVKDQLDLDRHVTKLILEAFERGQKARK